MKFKSGDLIKDKVKNLLSDSYGLGLVIGPTRDRGGYEMFWINKGSKQYNTIWYVENEHILVSSIFRGEL